MPILDGTKELFGADRELGLQSSRFGDRLNRSANDRIIVEDEEPDVIHG
jgi:hypothetical protein